MRAKYCIGCDVTAILYRHGEPILGEFGYHRNVIFIVSKNDFIIAIKHSASSTLCFFYLHQVGKLVRKLLFYDKTLFSENFIFENAFS